MLRRTGPRLGIRTVRDLLLHLPRRYEDLRTISTVGQLPGLPDGSPVTLRLRVLSVRVEPTFRQRVQRTVAVLADASGEVEATWFGRRFIERRLRPGQPILASGRVRLRGRRPSLDNPEFQPDDGAPQLHAGRIVPIYPLTEGLSGRLLRSAIRAALDRFGPYPEYLPAKLREGLPDIGRAIEQAHFPTGFPERDLAQLRLAHDELLALQLGMVGRRRQRQGAAAPRLAVDSAVAEALQLSVAGGLAARLGREVELTPDQLAAMAAIREDVAGDRPMLRLIQGDVGSGKTAVAAFALALAARTGAQAALLAPTDLLARQHAATIGDLLAATDVPVALLTGSLDAKSRRSALEAIAGGAAAVVVGTHAVMGEQVTFERLGLVVIDEQHRFGVAQREALAAKGVSPHVLLMTATPIPRTLGQVLYADLDVSDLRRPPEGRSRVLTGLKDPSALATTWRKMREEAAVGHRSFVVVPLIDPESSPADEPGAGAGAGSAHDDAGTVPLGLEMPAGELLGTEVAGERGAEEVRARLRRELAPLRVGLVHGRLKPAERDAEMARFRDGDLDVLVGTTVLEVGVDVPEATMMVILSADRFGLSQLHQLRGRVGRGEAVSYCVLVARVERGSVAHARLQALRRTNDGFLLAEEDFALRREGDVLGLAQSGLPRLRVASLAEESHRAMAVDCRRIAERVLDDQGRLTRSLASLDAELRHGWLVPVASGDALAEEGIGA